MPVDETGSHLKSFYKTGKPVVLIDRKIPGISSDCVLVDNEKAAERAVDLLFEKGHRNIGLIGGPREIYTAQERLRGYCNAHKKDPFRFRSHWCTTETIPCRGVSVHWRIW